MSPWVSPPAGTVKVNVNGRYDVVRRASAIGCVMRIRHDYWIGSYCGKIEHKSQTYVDLIAILHGFKLALEKDTRCVEIESDSRHAIELIDDKNSVSEFPEIVAEIREMMSGPWIYCVLRPIDSSSNCLAIIVSDYFIHKGVQLKRVDECPAELFRLVALDWANSI